MIMMLCKLCKAKEITPIKVTQRIGSQTREAMLCPNCGKEIEVRWTKKKKEKRT